MDGFLYPLQAAVIKGDARAIPLRDGSVHCVVTSPPYWGLRDYGQGGQLGLEATPDEYLSNMVGVFREVWRVLRDDGTCWVNMGDCYAAGKMGRDDYGDKTSGLNNAKQGSGKTGNKHSTPTKQRPAPPGLKPKDLVGMPWRLALALQADGWYLRSDIIWSKPNPMPESVRDRPTKAHEYVFLLSKRGRYFYDADAVREGNHTLINRPGYTSIIGNKSTDKYSDGTKGVRRSDGDTGYINPAGRNLRDVWHIATQPYPEAHFATYPEKLVEPCIKAGTSQKGVCAACGAPWVRVVEHTGANHREQEVIKTQKAMAGINPIHKKDGKNYHHAQRGTNSWRPSCACDAGTVPAIVFDPFGGSGTTAAVALKLGRRAVSLDIGYHELSKKRVFGA
jgi:DNA modification methylase